MFVLSRKHLDGWRGTCWFLVTHVAAQTLVLLVSKSRLLPQPFGWVADTLWVLCAPPLVPRARATCGPYVWRSSQNKSEHDPKTTLVCVCVCARARAIFDRVPVATACSSRASTNSCSAPGAAVRPHHRATTSPSPAARVCSSTSPSPNSFGFGLAPKPRPPRV